MVVTHSSLRPTALEIARLVREMIKSGATDREHILSIINLNRRQLRRRLDGEVPFTAHDFVTIMNNPKPRKVPDE